ncbi:MAG: FecR domain-containing protein [Planctomycetes bacterium]|nr:FecR domain-containing protein [Planctomycetota bacterium]
MNDHRLKKLITRWLDDSIDPEEFSSLETTLEKSASARRTCLAFMSVDAEIFILATASKDHLQTPTLKDVGLGKPSGQHKAVTPRTFAFLAIAAGLLLALGIWRGASPWKQAKSIDEQAVVSESLILAEIEPVSDACRWYVENVHRSRVESYRSGAESYRSGDIIRVTRGKLNLRYPCGTKVVLHSPAAYQLISDKDALILAGRLTASVSEAGIGFSVITPRATVVDLGTDFGVEVNNDGATDVVVFQGKVDVEYHDDRVSVQRLNEGEAVHLDVTGTVSRIVSISSLTYSGQSLPGISQPTVIAQVRDNISTRTSLFKFYEIVHAGMDEDALAYVDRPHEYNGITKEGMPSYLLGGDYVKMFNEDKVRNDIQVQVKLAVAAKLYILFDDRLTPPKWLRDNFRDTGDNIGMETGGTGFYNGKWRVPKSPPRGVGPGVVLGVIDTHSVWVRDVPNPGTVTLGAITSSDTKLPGPVAGKRGGLEYSMYGIVAVPSRR